MKSMMLSQRIDNIKQLYNTPIEEMQLADKSYTCVVCEKNYKTKSGIEKHLGEQSCYDIGSVYADSYIERQAYDFFKTLNLGGYGGMGTFRKNRHYKGIMRLALFCVEKNENSMTDYHTWATQVMKRELLPVALKYMVNEQTLRLYRKFMQSGDYIQTEQNERFLTQHRDDLIKDQNFFILSIERAHISFDYLSKLPDFPLDDIVDNLPIDYINRLQEILS